MQVLFGTLPAQQGGTFMQKFIMLCGLPACGKSTLAEKYIGEGYLVVSIDGSWDRRLKKVGPTKGRYARKTVIPLVLGERLLAMRPDGLLFCTGRKKTPLSRFHFERLFNNACNAIGIDEDTRKARGITLHSLRHFAVTMQHAAEDEVSDMAEVIRQSSGHRSVSMDRRYTHAAVRKLLAMGILSEKVLEDAP